MQWLAGLAIVLFAARSLARNWVELRSQPLDWSVRPGWLLLSAAVIWLMYAVLIVAWRVMLSAWGQRLGGWEAARIWTVSSLGKYLPGKVWAIAGMAVMSQRAALAAYSKAFEAAHPGARAALALMVAGALIGVGLLLWPPLLRRLLGFAAPGSVADRTPSAHGIMFGILANLIAWLGYGTALWLLARGLLPGVRLEWLPAVAVFAASYLAGFLALFAPGGIGVREGLFILMLQQPLGIGAATALALASRLLLTITELGAAVPFLAFFRERVRVAP